ncbi:MAG: magnesium transporter CorA family protein [Chloroflexi bacterium]|nr:magnesium transporter CorA family protein [Chloroflexota bacterium]
MTTSIAKAPPPNMEVITQGDLLWINMERPKQAEADYLAERFQFHHLDLENFIEPQKLPKINDYDQYFFLVLHLPVFHKAERVTRPSEIDFFVGKDFVITGHDGDLKPLIRFFRECQTNQELRQEVMGEGAGYLLFSIMDRLVDYCFPMLSKIADNLDGAEEQAFSHPAVATVLEIMAIKRDIISYRRVIRPMLAVFEELEQKDRPYLDDDLPTYFGFISDRLNKVWNSLEEYREVAEVLSDSSNWLANLRTQETMRVLTLVMAILLPLSIITGFYGMNIWLPGGNAEGGDPLPFFFLIGIMVAAAAVIFYIFRRYRLV